MNVDFAIYVPSTANDEEAFQSEGTDTESPVT